MRINRGYPGECWDWYGENGERTRTKYGLPSITQLSKSIIGQPPPSKLPYMRNRPPMQMRSRSLSSHRSILSHIHHIRAPASHPVCIFSTKRRYPMYGEEEEKRDDQPK